MDKWKEYKISHYYKQGWDHIDIANKLNVPTYEVVDILFDDHIVTTALGSKTEAYSDNEMDYGNYGSAPLPQFVILD